MTSRIFCIDVLLGRPDSAAKCPLKDSEPLAPSFSKTRYSPKNNATAAFSLTAS